MLPKTLLKSFDKGRLRNLLALIFFALAVPTAVLIWQAYGQLKWEAFHQHRGLAEELTRRIDTRLNEMIRMADAGSFADYTFLVVSGDPSANFVQRSPLSAYPVTENLPGLLGYFQVDTAGVFSTPLLPPAGPQAAVVGITESEYSERLQLARDLQAILADNRLVRARTDQDAGRDRLSAVPALEPEELQYRRRVATEPETGGSNGVADPGVGGTSAAGGSIAAAPTDKEGAEAFEPSAPVADNGSYSQLVFDRLNQLRSADGASDDAPGAAPQREQIGNSIAKVSDIKLDEFLQQKSEAVERQASKEQLSDEGFAARSKRREKIALPESVQALDRDLMAEVAESDELRISTFESEIDPFDFSLLDSGHFVLFRKVWRDGERYIQGLLVDQETFVQSAIGSRFMNTALSDMSNLIVAYQDDVIRTFVGRYSRSYRNVAEGLDGALLYRSRLTAPLNSLELIFSIKRLPAGAGAGVLGWVTLILASVLVGSFAVLYRLGVSQIDLARQQQDFVSAVSHELKTPLTSIRMYGEMLKEGWADEEKRQGYYEFIHDESERLSKLISNVLQLARITRSKPQFDLKTKRVGELMSTIESKISNQVERAGFELRFRTDAEAEWAAIDIDEDCFSQIIINLVDNAIKFCKDAQPKVIEISSKLSGSNRVVFSVRDFGPGIEKDQMQKIFELFYRSESELTRETVGTGIGLAIVHQLTLAMNGSVDLINKEPGAQFRLSFPIAS